MGVLEEWDRTPAEQLSSKCSRRMGSLFKPNGEEVHVKRYRPGEHEVCQISRYGVDTSDQKVAQEINRKRRYGV